MGERLKINQNNQTSNQSNKKSDNENITRAEKTSILLINKLSGKSERQEQPWWDGPAGIQDTVPSCATWPRAWQWFWTVFEVPFWRLKKNLMNLMNKILRVYSVPLNHQTIWLISWKDYLTPPTFSRTLRWKSRDWRIWKNLCFDLRACLLLLFFCTLWWIFFKLLSFRSESCRVENNCFCDLQHQ